MRRVTVPG
jgi:hypothetical protein